MVVEKPRVQEDSYRGDAGKEKPKNISPRGFRFTDTSQERVLEALKKNAILESSPLRRTITCETDERIMDLRPEFPQKHLSRGFRFKPTCEAERVADAISRNTGTRFQKSVMPVNELLIQEKEDQKENGVDNTQPFGGSQFGSMLSSSRHNATRA